MNPGLRTAAYHDVKQHDGIGPAAFVHNPHAHRRESALQTERAIPTAQSHEVSRRSRAGVGDVACTQQFAPFFRTLGTCELFPFQWPWTNLLVKISASGGVTFFLSRGKVLSA
jgi:hypothetical protein